MLLQADFVNVLSEMGREDFTEQLMLALHQFQDSDNIPWSGKCIEELMMISCFNIMIGSELLNALFYQHFSVGTPYPIAAMHDRMQQVKERTLQHQLTQDHSSSAAATATEQPFPGKGGYTLLMYFITYYFKKRLSFLQNLNFWIL